MEAATAAYAVARTRTEQSNFELIHGRAALQFPLLTAQSEPRGPGQNHSASVYTRKRLPRFPDLSVNALLMVWQSAGVSMHNRRDLIPGLATRSLASST